ncbi:hypothetical protein OAB57_01470 [Bacteriovoracaceae bacterium]|nr:hypothetical protein [Bacteriovoracaceae bacterium]
MKKWMSIICCFSLLLSTRIATAITIENITDVEQGCTQSSLHIPLLNHIPTIENGCFVNRLNQIKKYLQSPEGMTRLGFYSLEALSEIFPYLFNDKLTNGAVEQEHEGPFCLICKIEDLSIASNSTLLISSAKFLPFLISAYVLANDLSYKTRGKYLLNADQSLYSFIAGTMMIVPPIVSFGSTFAIDAMRQYFDNLESKEWVDYFSSLDTIQWIGFTFNMGLLLYFAATESCIIKPKRDHAPFSGFIGH